MPHLKSHVEGNVNNDIHCESMDFTIDHASGWTSEHLSFAFNAILPRSIIKMHNSMHSFIPMTKSTGDSDMGTVTGSMAEKTFIPPYAHIERNGQEFVMGPIHYPDLDYLVYFHDTNQFDIVTDNSPPGFCQLVHKETSRLLLPISLAQRDNENTHGPAVMLNTIDVDYDLVPALHFFDDVAALTEGEAFTERRKEGLGWPSQFHGFLRRVRPSGWPSSESLDGIYLTGFHIVAAVHPFKTIQNMYMDWRFSFSYAELQLIIDLNSTQRKCFILLKIYRKTCWSEFEFLTSYQLKNTLFWACEKIPQERWTEENIATCMIYLLDQLLHYITEGKLPHFFNPDHNLLAGMTRKDQRALLKKIVSVRKDPIEHILKFIDEFTFIGGPITTNMRDILEPITQNKSGSQSTTSIFTDQSLALAAAYLKDFLVWTLFANANPCQMTGLVEQSLRSLDLPPIPGGFKDISECPDPWTWISEFMMQRDEFPLDMNFDGSPWTESNRECPPKVAGVEYSLTEKDYQDFGGKLQDMLASRWDQKERSVTDTWQETNHPEEKSSTGDDIKVEEGSFTEGTAYTKTSDGKRNEHISNSGSDESSSQYGHDCLLGHFQKVVMFLAPFMSHHYFNEQARGLSQQNKLAVTEYACCENIVNKILPLLFSKYKEDDEFELEVVLKSLQTSSFYTKSIGDCMDHIVSTIADVINVKYADSDRVFTHDFLGYIADFKSKLKKPITFAYGHIPDQYRELFPTYLKCLDERRQRQIPGIVLFMEEFSSRMLPWETITLFLLFYATQNSIMNLRCALLILLIDSFKTYKLLNSGCMYILSAAAYHWPEEDIKLNSIFPIEYLLTKLRSCYFWKHDDLDSIENVSATERGKMHPINELILIRDSHRLGSKEEGVAAEKGHSDVLKSLSSIVWDLSSIFPDVFKFIHRMSSKKAMKGDHFPGSYETIFPSFVHVSAFFHLIVHPQESLAEAYIRTQVRGTVFSRARSLYEPLYNEASRLSVCLLCHFNREQGLQVGHCQRKMKFAEPFYYLFHNIEFTFGVQDVEASLEIYLQSAYTGSDLDVATWRFFRDLYGYNPSFTIHKGTVVEQMYICKRLKLLVNVDWTPSLCDPRVQEFESKRFDGLLQFLVPHIRVHIKTLLEHYWYSYNKKLSVDQLVQKLQDCMRCGSSGWTGFLSFLQEFYPKRNKLVLISKYMQYFMDSRQKPGESFLIDDAIVPEHLMLVKGLNIFCDDETADYSFPKLYPQRFSIEEPTEPRLLHDFLQGAGSVKLHEDYKYASRPEKEAFDFLKDLQQAADMWVTIPDIPDGNSFIALLMLLNRHTSGAVHLQLFLWRLKFANHPLLTEPLKVLKAYLESAYIDGSVIIHVEISPEAMYTIALSLLLGELYPLKSQNEAVSLLCQGLGVIDDELASSSESLVRALLPLKVVLTFQLVDIGDSKTTMRSFRS